MNKTLLLLLATTFVLWWCFNTQQSANEQSSSSDVQEATISPEAQAQADKRVTGNETCDNYLATLQCIGQKSAWSGNEFTQTYNSLLSSLQDTPVEQLQETCTNLTTALQEHPTMLIYNADCDMTRPTENQETIKSGSQQLTGM